mgnify:FL=1|jgi:hypothetical protein
MELFSVAAITVCPLRRFLCFASDNRNKAGARPVYLLTQHSGSGNAGS